MISMYAVIDNDSKIMLFTSEPFYSSELNTHISPYGYCIIPPVQAKKMLKTLPLKPEKNIVFTLVLQSNAY